MATLSRLTNAAFVSRGVRGLIHHREKQDLLRWLLKRKSWLDGGAHGRVDGTTSHVEGRNDMEKQQHPPSRHRSGRILLPTPVCSIGILHLLWPDLR